MLASVGAYQEEKQKKQNIVVNLEVELKNEKINIRDDLKNVINYTNFRKIIIDTVNLKHYNLLETLATDIAKNLSNNKNVCKFRIRIAKTDIFKDCNIGVEKSTF